MQEAYPFLHIGSTDWSFIWGVLSSGAVALMLEGVSTVSGIPSTLGTLLTEQLSTKGKRHDDLTGRRKSNRPMELKNDLTFLNNLRDLLVDSREGYMKAAERVEDHQVKAMLVSLSTGRLGLMQELDALRLAADPTAEKREGGTLKGDLHRAWMDLRDALSKSENVNVLSECERGEEYLIGRYEAIDSKEVDPRTYALCQRQRTEVQGNLQRIKALAKTFERIER